MLKKFEVAGFKNFKNKLTLDFADVYDYKFNENCITSGLVSKMIVYGRNATGKTNIGLAIFDIVTHFTDLNFAQNVYDYYLNANGCKEAVFSYEFKFDGDVVRYDYAKDAKRNLLRESVFLNETPLFEYDFASKKGAFDGLKALNPTLNLKFDYVDSVLRYVINNTPLEATHPLKKMMNFVFSMLWFRSLDSHRYIYRKQTKDYFDFICGDDKTLAEFQGLLSLANVNEKLVVLRDANGFKQLYFDRKTPLPFFKTASNGTKALYNFFYWYKTAKNVSFMFMDEFDAFYHFELSESIVKILEKMTETQVILTSHNTNLLSNKFMRPDCFFILGNNGITSFTKATSRELREGHNLENLYMSGEFDE